MKKLFLLFIPFISFSQVQKKKINMNQMMGGKTEIQMKKKFDSNRFQIKKKIEKKIVEKWEEYSKAFEYSDFDKITT